MVSFSAEPTPAARSALGRSGRSSAVPSEVQDGGAARADQERILPRGRVPAVEEILCNREEDRFAAPQWPADIIPEDMRPQLCT